MVKESGQSEQPIKLQLFLHNLSHYSSYIRSPFVRQKKKAMDSQIVLVTGGSGFIGAHVIVAALKRGYRVRTTVRSLDKADSVRQKLLSGGADSEAVRALEFVQADLLADKGWDEACAGCQYLHHVASPYPVGIPSDENELIKPAREGTMRALHAAKKSATIKRIVVMSSFAAVGYGQERRTKENPFTEVDWTNLDKPQSHVGPYEKSKTLAEQDAWKWYREEGKAAGIELATVNPVSVWGPSLGYEENTSLELAAKMLKGEVPGLPNLLIAIVDVRDVADLHMRAMESPKAAGQRYLAISDDLFVSAKGIADILREGLPAAETSRVPSLVFPDWLLKVLGLFDKSIGMVVPELSHLRPVSNAKAKDELGWKPRSAKEAILSGAESLKITGRVKAK